MKNRILSYLLGWIFVVFVWFMDSYAHAWSCTECETLDRDANGGKAYYTCMQTCTTQQQQQQQQQQCKDWCCGIKLNTDFPILWDCIHLKEWEGWVDGTTALPYMIWALMKIIMSIIMVICFIIIIIAWIKRASNDPKTAKDLIKKVAITILLLWLSGVILKVVNPLFFA